MARTTARQSAQPAWVSLGTSEDIRLANEPMVIGSSSPAYPEDAATVLAPIVIDPAESQKVMLELGLHAHSFVDASSAAPATPDASAPQIEPVSTERVVVVTLAAFACAACLAATAWVLLTY
jgi:hypothetical protein